jgi:hypothetical protein
MKTKYQSFLGNFAERSQINEGLEDILEKGEGFPRMRYRRNYSVYTGVGAFDGSIERYDHRPIGSYNYKLTVKILDQVWIE